MQWRKAIAEKMTGGITKSEHSKLHKRLIRAHGNASKCESDTCTHKNPKRFEWALRKGHSYSDNPADYIQLCVSCHRKYDFTENIRSRLISKKIGQNNNRSKLTDADVAKIRVILKSDTMIIDIAKQFGVSPTAIHNIKSGKRWKI